MVSQWSDAKLRKSLQEYGEVVGPITATTRSVLQKRLISLRKKSKQVSKLLSSDAMNSGEIEMMVRSKRIATRSGSPPVGLDRIRPGSFADSAIFETPPPRSPKFENDGSFFHRNQHGEVEARSSDGSSAFDVDSENFYSHDEPLRFRRKTASPTSTPDFRRPVSQRYHPVGKNYENSSTGFNYWNPDSHPQYRSCPYRSKSRQGEDSIILDADEIVRREVAAKSISSIVITFMNKVWTTFLCFALCQYLVIIPALLSLIMDPFVVKTNHREYYEATRRYFAIGLVAVAVIAGIPLQYWTMKGLKKISQQAEMYERFHQTEYADSEMADATDHMTDADYVYYHYG